jgi:hypothetical protein
MGSSTDDSSSQPMMKHHHSQPMQRVGHRSSKDSTPAEVAETQRLNEQALSKAGG